MFILEGVSGPLAPSRISSDLKLRPRQTLLLVKSDSAEKCPEEFDCKVGARVHIPQSCHSTAPTDRKNTSGNNQTRKAS